MTIKIARRITGYDVASKDAGKDTGSAESNVVQMHEKLERPETLIGNTYKLKTPLTEHAIYVTINDIVLNSGTKHEKRQPFEIFINSKSMEHFQWVVALTRVVSAVFRKGGDATFLVEEMHSVFDPRGGYFKKGRYVPSLVAELGDIIETHMRSIGLIRDPEPDPAREQFLSDKRAEVAARAPSAAGTSPTQQQNSNGVPANATLCAKCSVTAVVVLDGCRTCLNCGDSKCG